MSRLRVYQKLLYSHVTRMAEVKKVEKKITSKQKRVREEISQKTLGYILTAFGLVAGLAWNEAIKSLIEFLFPFNRDTLLAKFTYAFLMTLVLIIVSIHLANIFGLKSKKKEETEEDS